ncbi:glycoside hydrolase family 3 protein [Desarmillaria tabescens]|uniref:beta-glucosidase n=1 Tax=Armillaria tabescens TaxID=1929756 RepID=A0AA39TPA3_ARMTA|nr:glycoside hydrolase family 3 protein [Desarmillaria tabescens]KAK0461743.1 glycoside hydrolase family 3 protein [Desarmillaria tabescens]
MTFNVDETLLKLTLNDKVKLLTGLGWWHTEAIPHANIESMRMSDGPNGVRGTQYFNGVPSSCFPSSTGLGSSFDLELAYKIGEALGDECRAKSCHILLAPTVNTQRSPLGGRGFESFSEDGVLNGEIAAAYINGLQSKGVSATIKHYVANDQEHERFSVSSEVSERALREIYLKPFQIAIRKSDPWALMSSYNRVNGLHVSEDKRLLDDILRKEWGYKGLIMSDWTGVYSTVESIKAGVDLEMPGPSVVRGPAVLRAIQAGKLVDNDINDRVRKVLELLRKAHNSGISFNGLEEGVDTPELRKLLRRAAADSVVLLKNKAGLLPLSAPTSIAVIGPNAKTAMTSGGGSAQLLSTYTVSPLQGIIEAAKAVNAQVNYTVGATSHKLLPLLDASIKQQDGTPGALLEFWNEPPTPDFISPQADLNSSLKQPVWDTKTSVSNCILLDGVKAEKVSTSCWTRYSTTFIPDESGDWEFGMNVSGIGNMFIDKKIVIDQSTKTEYSKSFFGAGSTEVRAIVEGMKAGQEYGLEVRLSNVEFIARGPPFPYWGGFRLGGIRVVGGQEAIQEAEALARASDVVILLIGLNHDWESEGFDRDHMKLPGLTNDLVSKVLQANPRTVVVNQSGTPVEMPWIDDADTVLQAFYGGNELGNGLADVLFGKVNPSAKLSLTFPKRLEDNPSYPSFGNKCQEHGKVLYNEGIFVGYRGYEIKKTAPLFPFGFGLSYSKFDYSDLSCSEISPDGKFSVQFKITNSSGIDGREVAQIYISDVESSLPRPAKELKGFVKEMLKAGETKVIIFSLDRDALGYYDDRKSSWIAEKGEFVVLVGPSSADVRMERSIELKNTFSWVGL